MEDFLEKSLRMANCLGKSMKIEDFHEKIHENGEIFLKSLKTLLEKYLKYRTFLKTCENGEDLFENGRLS